MNGEENTNLLFYYSWILIRNTILVNDETEPQPHSPVADQSTMFAPTTASTSQKRPRSPGSEQEGCPPPKITITFAGLKSDNPRVVRSSVSDVDSSPTHNALPSTPPAQDARAAPHITLTPPPACSPVTPRPQIFRPLPSIDPTPTPPRRVLRRRKNAKKDFI